jgi:hypothetical protein
MNIARFLGRDQWLYNLILQALSGGGSSPGSTVWENVSNASSPFSANGFVRFACDTSAGPCTIKLNTPLLGGTRIYVTAVKGANPVIIDPTFITPPNASVPEIQDPSQQGGNIFNTTAVMSNGSGGQTDTWEYDAVGNRLIQVV